MSRNSIVIENAELTALLELSARVGRDPLLTQGSTGNTSIKLNGVLWIKASGKWLADAKHDDILIPLDLAEVQECVKDNVDPASRYTSASIETALHAVLPQRIVLHAHPVNTIAWAVRQDAQARLKQHLDGLRWQWIPYVASGLPLARQIQRVLFAAPGTDVFVFGNHGLVICGSDCSAVEDLLFEVERRLALAPRRARAADHAVLAQLAEHSSWAVCEDEAVHALGTDAVSGAVLSGGFLYPCQAIFSSSAAPALFRPIPCPNPSDRWESPYHARPFLILEGRGVIVSGTMTPAECAMISGLAQVVQRISAFAPIRYLTEAEVESALGFVAYRYRELANSRAR